MTEIEDLSIQEKKKELQSWINREVTRALADRKCKLDLRCPRFADAYQTVRAHRIVVGSDLTRWDMDTWQTQIPESDLELLLFYLRVNYEKRELNSLETARSDS